MQELLEQPTTVRDIEELELSVRAYNGLKRGGVATIEQITKMGEWELRKLVGKKAVIEIREILASMGLSLKDNSTADCAGNPERAVAGFNHAARVARALLRQGYTVEIRTNVVLPESTFDVIARRAFGPVDD